MKLKKKKLLIYLFTGKRGGFSHFIPLIRIFNQEKKVNYKILASDMHLSDYFGKTLNEIKKYTNKIIELKNNKIKDSIKQRTTVVSNTIQSISAIFSKKKPDFIILLGDRAEVLGASIAALHHNVPSIHMYGGDMTQGGTDEPTRHAISKLSNLHLTSNLESYKNVKQMGEENWRVFNTGLLSLDLLKKKNFKSKDYLSNKFDINFNKPFIILIQHPVTWQVNKCKKQIEETLKALSLLKIQTIAIYPCSDPGYMEIVKSYKKLKNKKFFKLHKNIEASDFYSLLKFCSLLIGNSSCGITECGFLKKSVINIGIRQEGRVSGKNVHHVEHNFKKILYKIKNILKMPNITHSSNIYGTGHSAKKIIKIINNKFSKDKLIIKKFNKVKFK